MSLRRAPSQTLQVDPEKFLTQLFRVPQTLCEEGTGRAPISEQHRQPLNFPFADDPQSLPGFP